MSSQGPLTPGRKGRKSWFDTPPLTSLGPKPVQDENARPKKSKRLSVDSVETLTLTHFTSAPRLGFGNAIVGSTKFRSLIIRNPHDYEQEVIIEKFPFKKKFYVNHTRFEVGPGDVFSLEITWTPEEAIGVREMVQFYINGVYRLQCYLFGTAENPKPVRKTRRRKFCPPVCENSVVIQTPALTRIKSNYNPRRSQELRDVQALVENKEFHHNNENESKLHEPIVFDDGKGTDCHPSPVAAKNEENVFIRPNPIDPVTPIVLESTSIGMGMRHEGESSSQQSRTKWKKMTSTSGGVSDDTIMTMSPIPVISDGSQNGMTVDSFYRPSEMGMKDQRPSNASEYRMKDTFVVPQAPFSQLVPDFPRLTFVCPTNPRPKDDQIGDIIAKGECLSSTVCVPSKSVNTNENTYSVANGALTPEAFKSNVTAGDKLIPSGMSPSTTIEFSKRVEWQSPQRSGTLNASSDLSSVSPNTILDQSLSFIGQVSTPVKYQRNHRDMDVSGNSSLISAGHGLVSPNSFMEEMKSSESGGMIGDHQDSSIPSPSTVFSNSIPHNLMIKHLDNINTSLLSNSPLVQSTKPLSKSKAGPKRRSLTTAYRVAEKKKTFQTKKSPPKAVDSRERSLNNRRENFSLNSMNMKRHSPMKRSLKALPSRRSPLNKSVKQKLRRSPKGKPFSPAVLRSKGKRHLNCSTPVNQSPKSIDSGTVVKNQSSNSFNSPFVADSDSPQQFPLTSPSCLPVTPGDDADVSSRRCTLTITKSRPSDALLTAMNNNRKKLFDNNCVHFAETCESTEDSMESRQECEKLKSNQTHEPSPSNQFCSPTHRNLPNSPNPEHSRRSTHVVRSPKVLDLSTIQQKRLDFEMGIGDDRKCISDVSLETEVKSKQDSPITSVCVMSPRVVDYETTSNEGSTSGQSVSIDSLDTSTSPCGAKMTAPVAVLDCENRVDILDDTQAEEEITITSLRTPCKDLDWSYCERGDTKVLPPKMDLVSTFTFGERNVNGIEEEMTATSSIHVMSAQQLPSSDTVDESRQEMLYKKKRLRRSVSAHEIHSSESDQPSDLTNSLMYDTPNFTQDDMSKTVVVGERNSRQAVFCDRSKHHSSEKSTSTLKTIHASQLDKMSSIKNETQQLRYNVAIGNKEHNQQKGFGNRSQSLNNINGNSTGTRVVSGVRGRGVRQETERAPAPVSKVVKNAVRNVPTAQKGMDKSKKGKGSVKGVAQSKLILVKKAKNAVPRHPMPFAARNMYYDERWMEKQENGFVQWLNFVLTPPVEYVAVTSKPKVDAVALTLGNQHQTVPPRLAPTKEVLSFRAYAARRRLNRLRRAACQLYQSDEVAAIIRKIEVEVESQRIAARKDRMLHADLGIKQRVLDLLLQYSSLWLRVGLETVFGEVLPLHSNTDVVGLSRFVVSRLLSCPDIAGQYAHPSVPHLYTEGYASALSRHTVKKFLLMIYFMDKAKTLRLIDHDPCLFCKDADIKSSKEILIQFSREVLSGEGDLTRHLAYLGYTVCQVQKPFDEFDYAVSNISSDLKDGLRLSRLLELLAGNSCIMGKLRTPAISRLQKIHNMEVFFSVMTQRGLALTEISGTTARDVVDGHREKTLSMLWHLILHFQANLNVDEEKLKEEIHLLTKSLQLKLAMQKIGAAFTEDCLARRDSGGATTFVKDERMQLIFRWCRLVCLHYGVKIENMTVSFSDGRALCCLLHHYHPVLLPLSDIRFQTSQQFQEAAEEVCDGDDPDLSVDWGKRGGGLCPNEDDPAYFEKLLANERSNFKVLYEKVSALGGVPLMVKHTHMSNTIPDEKVVTTYVSYLCLRLLDIREEVKAARVIQMAWRRRRLRRTFKQRLWAAQIIQKWYRKRLAAKQQRMMEERNKMEAAAIKLQTACRVYLEKSRLKRLKAVIVLQSFWRMKKAQNVVKQMAEMKLENKRKEKLRQEDMAAVTIQKFYRGFLVRKEWNCTKRCVRVLQNWWRMMKAKRVVLEMKLQRQREMKENEASVTIQKCYRGFKVRQEKMYLEKCVTVLQSLWRMRKAKCFVSAMRLQKEREVIAAVTIQKCYRGFKVRQENMYLEKCVTVLQSLWRMRKAKCFVAVMRLQKEREVIAAVTIQKCYRGFKVRQEKLYLEKCVTVLQSLWRMRKAKCFVSAMRLQKEREVIAAVTIQKCYRGFKVRQENMYLEKCVTVLQSLWRMRKAKCFVAAMRLQKEREVIAAVTIQKCYRGFKVREEMKHMNKYATVLQCFWRVHLAKKVMTAKWQKRELEAKEEQSAIIVQKSVRGWLCRRDLCQMRDAAVCVQKNWRGYLGRKRASAVFNQLQEDSAVIIQKLIRGWICRQKFRQTQKAAICIQRMWRAFMIGQYLEQEEERRQTAATVIQAWYKKCAQQQKYQTLKSKVIFVQRKYRGIIKGREVRAEFLWKKVAVISLQRAWRQYALIRDAKRVLEEKMKIRKEEEMERKRIAAVLIQSYYRGYKCRQGYGKMISACVIIQSLWRMQRAKMVFQKTKHAALIIQNSWRKAMAMRQLNKLRHSRDEKAAICIQKNYRAHAERSNFLRLKRSAVTLQTHWRCFLIRKELIQMQMVRNERERAACVLQAFVRGAIQRRNFLRVKNAAAVLQEFYHNHLLARQQVESDAATVIQSAFRGYLCYKRYRAQRDAALVIQDWFRRSQAMEGERMTFLESRSCAITIQSYFRMYKDRKQFLIKQKAVVILQTFARRIQAEEQYNLKRNAALIIQMYFRAWKSGKIFRQAYVLIRDSCITIQRFYRREKARKERVLVLCAENAAAVKIQTCYKRYVQQKQYLAMQSAAKLIQRKYRSIQHEKKLRSDLKERTEAAVTIQNSWRRFAMIKEARNVLEERRTEKRVEEKRQREEGRRNDAAIIVQRSWQRLRRMREATKEVEQRKKEKQQVEERLRNEAALVIQQTYKHYKLVQEARVMLGQKRDEMRLEEERREEQTRKKEKAATVIQRSWMRLRQMMEACAVVERMREEARLQEEEKLRTEAATLIQQTYRRFKLMQEAKLILELRREVRKIEVESKRRDEEEMEEAVVCIQLWWRQGRSVREAKSILKEKKQAKLKKEEVRKLRFEQEYLAAVVIQTAWREVLKMRQDKFILEQDMEKAISSAVKDEERDSLNEADSLNDAEIRRMEEESVNFEERKENEQIVSEDERPVKIEDIVIDTQVTDGEDTDVGSSENEGQNKEYGQQQKEDECERRRDAEVLEERQVQASEIIQNNIKDFLKCEQENSRLEAATVIQKYFRGYQQRCEFLRTIQAVITIQSHARAFIQRKEFGVYRASVCLVQQRWRERNLNRRLRERFVWEVKAACVIQSWYRQARIVKRERAAVRIQALWRGHSIRRDLKCKKLKAARKRLQEANQSDNKNTLGSRTASALAYLLADNDMAYVLSALMNLEVSTRLSPVCCERLVEANAVSVLVKLLSSCNRSVPHMEIIKYTTDILLNLATYDKTVDSLMDVHNLTSVVLNVMQIFREKGTIFFKSCALLGTLARKPDRRRVLLKCPQLVDRVRSMHTLALRKQRTTDKRLQKTPAKSTTKTKTKEFQDPLTAIQFVMSCLHLNPK